MNPQERSNMEGANERLHVLVEGRVQGVGFRYFVLIKGQELNLTGWVRNLWDGRVEVTAEGPKPVLDNLLEVLKEGPRSAEVSDLIIDWLPATNEFKQFEVRF
jgi:acylphosphatase